MAVIEADGLTKHFGARGGGFFGGGGGGIVRAVDGISFKIERGQTLGIVGESGCGKTTTAKLVLGLEKPTGGTMRFEGAGSAGSSTPPGGANTANRSRPCFRTPTPRSARECGSARSSPSR